MDDDAGLGIRNWGCYESYLKGDLGLQLMSPAVPAPERDVKPLLGGQDSSSFMINANNGGFHHRECGVPESSLNNEFTMRDNWIGQREIGQRERHFVLQGNPNYGVLSEASGTHGLQMLQQPDYFKDDRMTEMEETGSKSNRSLKKKAGSRAQKSPKTRKPKKVVPKDEINGSVRRAKPARNTGLIINGMGMDISGIPSPVCSCTGSPQQCYRWGCGGWQSACCTTGMSMYPLPMSTKRRGARIAGRKMSQGAFKKVLEKLAAEGYNFSQPIDLRTHWAKHGTNKFVTIRRGAKIAGRKMSQGAFKKVLKKLAAEGYNFSQPIDLRTHWAKRGTHKFVTIR